MREPVAIRVIARTEPKQGQDAQSNDDACYWFPRQPPVRRGALPLRAAVSDGASGSLFAGQWSTILSRAFCMRRIPFSRTEWPLAALSEEWKAASAHRLQELYKGQVPWYLEEKIGTPAGATLAAVEIVDSGDSLKWRAILVGDACVMRVCHESGNRAFLESVPISHSDRFDSSPELVASAGDNRELPAHIKDFARLEVGDTLYLLTDAVAQWFLRQVEANGTPWEVLDVAMATRDSFRVWLQTIRDNSEIANDDVTVLALHWR